jgi:hypothetical protein
VGDGSNLVKTFALVLAASIGLPALGPLLRGTVPGSTPASVEIRSAGAVRPLRTVEIKRVTERHRSFIHVTFDDDDAVLSDETEYWVDVRANVGLEHQAVYAQSPSSSSSRPLATLSPFFSSQTAPFPCLCRYQC